MRYFNVPQYTFTDLNGNSYNIYQRRDIPVYQTSRMINILQGEDFDERFSRPDIAGDNSEGSVFQLHEANLVAIIDAKFDYSKLRSIKVPVLSDLG